MRKGRERVPGAVPQPGHRPRWPAAMPDPADPETFERCKLDLERARGARRRLALHRDLLRLRREDPAFARQAAAASTARCSGRRRSCSASSAPASARTTACCWSTSAPTSHLDAGARAAAGAARGPSLGGPLVERGPALRRRRTPAGGDAKTTGAPRPRGRGAAAGPAPGRDGRCLPVRTEIEAEAVRRPSTWPVRSDACPGPETRSAQPRPRPISLVDARVAGHQRPGRLRLGHRRRRRHPPLPRPADRRAARAAAAASMMLNHLAERLRLPDQPPWSSLGGAGVAGSRLQTARAPATCASSASRPACPVWRYEVDGYRPREAGLPAHLQNTVHVTLPAASTAPERGAPGAAPVGPLPPARRAGDRRRSTRPTASAWSDDRYEIVRRDGPAAAAPASARREPVASRSTGAHRQEIYYRLEDAPRLRVRGDLWSPGYFRVDLAPRRRRDAGRLDRAWETIEALQPDEALEAELERRERLLAAADPRGPGRARRPSWCWPPTSSSSRPPAASRTPPAPTPPATRSARVIAGYHWFTDWGRDTMISLEGLTLTTGRHAEAGYILRTFAHYVRDGLIPNMFPEGETRGPLPHRRRHPLVLPRHRPLRRAHRRPRHARACCCPKLIDIVEHHLRRHALRHRRRPGRRPAAPGRRGLPAHLDGRQGRTTGSSRRGAARRSRSTRSGTTPCGCSKAGCASDRRRRRRAGAARRARRARRASRSTAGSGTSEGGYLYDVVDGEQRRRSRLPAQPDLRHLAAASGARPRALGAGGRRRAASGC